MNKIYPIAMRGSHRGAHQFTQRCNQPVEVRHSPPRTVICKKENGKNLKKEQKESKNLKKK